MHGVAHDAVRALAGDPPADAPPWSGSAEHILELLQGVADHRVCRELLLCHDSLVSAARHDHAREGGTGWLTPFMQQRWQGLLAEVPQPAESGEKPVPRSRQQQVSLLLLHASCHRALHSAVAEELSERSQSLQEQLGLAEAPARGGGKAGGKGGKAPAKGKSGKQDEENVSPEKMKEQYSTQLYAEVAGMLWDAVDQTFTLWDQQMERLDRVVDGKAEEAFAAEIAEKERERNPPPAEEPAPDAA